MQCDQEQWFSPNWTMKYPNRRRSFFFLDSSDPSLELLVEHIFGLVEYTFGLDRRAECGVGDAEDVCLIHAGVEAQ